MGARQSTITTIENVYAHDMHTGKGHIINQSEGSLSGAGKCWTEERLEQLNHNFKQNLTTLALQICGEEDPFRGRDIELAPIKIRTNFDEKERFGYWYKSKFGRDINPFPFLLSHTVDLETDSENFVLTQLFVEAKKFAKKMSSTYCSNEEAVEAFELCRARVAFVVGEAGIGKSALSKVLVQKMLHNKNPLYGAEIVFYIRLRNIDCSRTTDLLHFLTQGSSICQNYTNEERKKILETILNCGNGVCIVMDGLDEAIIKSKKYRPEYDIHSQATPEGFLKNLVDGKLLPQSRLIITSRPRQLPCLTENYKSYFRMTILGLTKEGQKQICQNLSEDPERREKLLNYIRCRSDLEKYCSVPIYCIQIMRSLNDMEDEKEWSNISSLTSVIVNSFCSWYLKKLKGEFQTKEIAELAYLGFLEDRYHFQECDFREVGVNFENLTTFLTTTFQILDGTAMISYFSHLTWQEFGVALRLRLYTKKEEFKEILSELGSAKYEVVANFLFGLCNNRLLRKLLDHVAKDGLNSLAERAECEKMLKDFAVEKISEYRPSEPSRDAYFRVSVAQRSCRTAVQDFGQDFRDISFMLRWVYECNDNDFPKQVAESLAKFIRVKEQFRPDDILSFNHVLRARQSIITLTVSDPAFRQNVSQFFKELATTLQLNRSVQLKKMHFSENWMRNTHCFECVGKIREFVVRDVYNYGGNYWQNFENEEEGGLFFVRCPLDHQDLTVLAEKILQRTGKLEKLVLSDCKVGDDGALLLLGCLPNIDIVHLRNCGISKEMLASLRHRGDEVGCVVWRG